MTSLKSKMTHYELSKTIMNIWEQLKSDSFHQMCQDTMTSCFSKYLLDPAECQKKAQYLDEEKYQKVMSETLDVVESDDFQTVLTDCVKESLEHLLQLVEPHFQYKGNFYLPKASFIWERMVLFHSILLKVGWSWVTFTWEHFK